MSNNNNKLEPLLSSEKVVMAIDGETAHPGYDGVDKTTDNDKMMRGASPDGGPRPWV